MNKIIVRVFLKCFFLNLIVTFVPSPYFEIKMISAPYKLQICFTIESQNPVPPVSRERDLFTL